VLAAALIALLFIINEQPPRLVVQTPGIFAFAPSDWWVRVKIQPHADDRWLEIEVDGDAFYRRSDIQLEGESSPRIYQVWFRKLPAGCYQITATVRATGERGRVLARANGRRLSVRGFADEGDPCGTPI
jgi:hypothetical protein